VVFCKRKKTTGLGWLVSVGLRKLVLVALIALFVEKHRVVVYLFVSNLCLVTKLNVCLFRVVKKTFTSEDWLCERELAQEKRSAWCLWGSATSALAGCLYASVTEEVIEAARIRPSATKPFVELCEGEGIPFSADALLYALETLSVEPGG
jgi:hypothetical protein